VYIYGSMLIGNVEKGSSDTNSCRGRKVSRAVRFWGLEETTALHGVRADSTSGNFSR